MRSCQDWHLLNLDYSSQRHEGRELQRHNSLRLTCYQTSPHGNRNRFMFHWQGGNHLGLEHCFDKWLSCQIWECFIYFGFRDRETGLLHPCKGLTNYIFRYLWQTVPCVGSHLTTAKDHFIVGGLPSPSPTARLASYNQVGKWEPPNNAKKAFVLSKIYKVLG